MTASGWNVGYDFHIETRSQKLKLTCSSKFSISTPFLTLGGVKFSLERLYIWNCSKEEKFPKNFRVQFDVLKVILRKIHSRVPILNKKLATRNYFSIFTLEPGRCYSEYKYYVHKLWETIRQGERWNIYKNSSTSRFTDKD